MVTFGNANVYPTNVAKSVWKTWSDGSPFNDINANLYPIDFVIGTGQGFIAGYDTGGFKVTTDTATGLTINSGVYYIRTTNTSFANDVNRQTAVRIYAPTTTTLNVHPFESALSQTGWSWIYLDENGAVNEATGMDWSGAVTSTANKLMIAKIVRDGNNTIAQSDIIDERRMPPQQEAISTQRGLTTIGRMVIPRLTYTGAAIQEAIDSLPSSGGKIYIPEGTWVITSAITRTLNNVTIEGAGGNNTILTGDINGGNIITIGGDHWTISNLQVRNTNDTASTNSGIRTNDHDYYNIHDCTFEYSEIQIYIDSGSLYGRINNNIFLETEDLATPITVSVYIEDVESATYNNISNNTFICNHPTVDKGYKAIIISSNNNIIIGNNIIGRDAFNSAQTQYGIYVHRDYNIIIGNSCVNFQNAGASDGVGIYINNTSDECIVHSNFLSGNDTDLSDNGTNTHKDTADDAGVYNNIV